ncbi:MAG: DUF6775 family putative metallopeptidase, partial [Candidatus Thermoplasmatota archaeon]|nr:DUF6775 family putative metallopeptidase [Candidatus Thermoplasmatota archaeon]
TGHPTIVSPPGLIDGPARDRSYYMAKQVIGGSAEAFSQDDHLTREDERLPTCIASALLQAAAWHTTGQAFCEEEGCRLFNPHWQKDLLATMATAELCTEHQRWLEAR